jgi:hypothetical protein
LEIRCNGQGNKKITVLLAPLLWKLCEVVGMAGFWLAHGWDLHCMGYIVKHAYNIALFFLI